MRNKYTFFLSMGIYVTVQFIAVNTIAQCNCATNCDTSKVLILPKMWVNRDDTKKRISAFKDDLSSFGKYARLQRSNGFQEPGFFIPIDVIDSLLSKIKSEPKYEVLRIYFARYDISNSPDPNKISLKDKQLILLFTAGDEKEDYGICYLIDNKKVVHDIPIEYKKNWIKNYKKNNLSSLNQTIDKVRDNYDTVEKEYSDTKSIFYNKEDIEDAFVKEVYYQENNNHTKTSGFFVSLSSYGKMGKIPTSDDFHQYKKRLFIQFDYVNKELNKIFYIDDQPDFDCRKCKTCLIRGSAKFNDEKAVDNGHLCPANCPK